MVERQFTVVFDVDGVMHRIVNNICKRFGMEPDKVTEYYISENALLSEEEKALIKRELSSVEMFKYSWPEVTEEEKQLMRQISEVARIKINSLNYSEDIAEFKAERIREFGDCISEEDIDLRVVKSSRDKEPVECDIVVEDSLDNILKYKSKYKNVIGILTDDTYNKKYSAIELLNIGVVLCDNFCDAMRCVLKIIDMQVKR